jgi:hypothetical protein
MDDSLVLEAVAKKNVILKLIAHRIVALASALQSLMILHGFASCLLSLVKLLTVEEHFKNSAISQEYTASRS